MSTPRGPAPDPYHIRHDDPEGLWASVREPETLKLNIADVCTATHALGPGVRAVAWVQGCPFRCPSCIAPEWIPDRPATAMTPAALAERLLSDPRVDGITFSGGEPMQQAAGLSETIRRIRRRRDVSLICFTGYLLEHLRDAPPAPGVAELLADVDVLIDGPYVARRNTDRGLRGSDNQRVHHLTRRMRDTPFDFASRPRTVEVQVTDDGFSLIGVPPRRVAAAVASLADDVSEPSTITHPGARP